MEKPKNVIDLTGKKFERWFVKGFSHKTGKRYFWDVVCDCGNERKVIGYEMTCGQSRSCGCLHKEIVAANKTTHGNARHPSYMTWRALRARCQVGKIYKRDYSLYAGRGISFDPKWQTYEGFWEDMSEGWFNGASIDRVDTNGNYCKSNCRWATQAMQANNRRTNRMIWTPKGLMNVSEASKIFGIDRQTIYSRIRHNWREQHLLNPIDQHPKKPRK